MGGQKEGNRIVLVNVGETAYKGGYEAEGGQTTFFSALLCG